MQLFALFRLGFPPAPYLKYLTLLHIVTRWLVLQKARRRTLRTSTICGHTVSGSISLPSRGSFHLSLTVLFSIGHWVVFSLGRWSSLLPTRFLVSRGTLDHILASNCFAYRPITFSESSFQMYSATVFSLFDMSATPHISMRFGLFRVRSPLLTESLFIFSS